VRTEILADAIAIVTDRGYSARALGSAPERRRPQGEMTLGLKWSAAAVVAMLSLLAVSAATATWASPLDAQMTVGEPYTLPSRTVLVEEAPGDIGFGTVR
jgi:hypothetical protein